VDEDPDILCWSIKNNQNTENCNCIFIGSDNQTFFNISTAIKSKKWFLFDIDSSTMKEIQSMDTKFIMKRSHYVEKCKDAQTIGIVVGTLTTKGYLDAIKHIQELATKRGVKTYIFSVGKINPAKLANFSEVDCFVLVGCPENNLYTSRDFYKPLISVFEAELALNPSWHFQVPETYSTDFREILPEGKHYKSSNEARGASGSEVDVSLVTGKVRSFRTDEASCVESSALQEKSRNEVAELNSLMKLNERSFRGLDPNLGKDAPAKIEQGRKGLAIKYEEEN
jgi:diphthamide biosynthesis protein 2